MGNRSRTPLLVAALVLALCALAAGSGDGLRWSGLDVPVAEEAPAGSEPEGGSDEGESLPDEGEAGAEPPVDEPVDPPAFTIERLVAILVLVVLVAIVVTVLAQLRLAVRRRRLAGGRLREGVGLQDQPPPADEADDEVLADALGSGLDELGTGAPRNGIVAAWHRLERAAETEHFTRDPADTPTEFVERVLASYSLDAEAIDRLAALYREARFSEHPMSEDQRHDARRCLVTLLGDLHRARTGGSR